MKNKLLVEIYLPAAGRSFDMRIPADSRMGEINALVASIAADLSGGSYRATGTSVLVNAADGRIFDTSMTPSDLEIKNGTKLILI